MSQENKTSDEKKYDYEFTHNEALQQVLLDSDMSQYIQADSPEEQMKKLKEAQQWEAQKKKQVLMPHLFDLLAVTLWIISCVGECKFVILLFFPFVLHLQEEEFARQRKEMEEKYAAEMQAMEEKMKQMAASGGGNEAELEHEKAQLEKRRLKDQKAQEEAEREAKYKRKQEEEQMKRAKSDKERISFELMEAVPFVRTCNGTFMLVVPKDRHTYTELKVFGF